MRRSIASLLITIAILAVVSTRSAQAAPKYKLTADVIHDNEIYRLRGYWLGEYDGEKLLSQRTISKADWKILYGYAKDFIALPKSAYRDPDLGDDGEGKPWSK